MGNSHIRNIKTRYFINDCLVNKIMVFSFNQAIEIISSLDNDYDCVFVQVFTNHLRESSPKECAQLCTKFSVELSQQCEFAKIVISLPFPTGMAVNICFPDDHEYIPFVKVTSTSSFQLS